MAILFGTAAQLLAMSAGAKCGLVSSCICPFAPPAAIVQARVVAVQDGAGLVQLEAVDVPVGATTTLVAGDTASVTHPEALAVGRRFLGIASEMGEVGFFVRIDADERVSCMFAPAFRPTAAEARAAMASPGCHDMLLDLGLRQPHCNDTLGCSARPASPSAGAWTALALVGALLIGRRRTCRSGGEPG